MALLLPRNCLVFWVAAGFRNCIKQKAPGPSHMLNPAVHEFLRQATYKLPAKET